VDAGNGVQAALDDTYSRAVQSVRDLEKEAERSISRVENVQTGIEKEAERQRSNVTDEIQRVRDDWSPARTSPH
jgi:hypothetical protein